MREYKTVRKLQAGETIEFEGIKVTGIPGGKFMPGDTYIAERNTGPQLLTVKRIVVENNLLGGYIIPVEAAYAYDLPECVKVHLDL